MRHDSIVEEIDVIRRAFLAECSNDLNGLLNRMAELTRGRAARVVSVSELDARFPAVPVDHETISTLGEPCWRDPIVEEVHRVREQMSLEREASPPKDPPRAKSA